MPYAPELRSLRPDIQGAPRIRMGGPTEQYRRSRGQQKSFGLGQLYPQQLQGPQITGWKPGPLQLDPIRRVGAGVDERPEKYRAGRVQQGTLRPAGIGLLGETEGGLDARLLREQEEERPLELETESAYRERLRQELEAKGPEAPEADPLVTARETVDARATEIQRQTGIVEEHKDRVRAWLSLGYPHEDAQRWASAGKMPSVTEIRMQKQAKEKAAAQAAAPQEEAPESIRARANESAQLEYLDYEGASTEVKRNIITDAKHAIATENDLGAKIFMQLIGERYPAYIRD